MHALITPDKLRDCAARARLHRRVGAVTHATLGRLGRHFSSDSAAAPAAQARKLRLALAQMPAMPLLRQLDHEGRLLERLRSGAHQTTHNANTN